MQDFFDAVLPKEGVYCLATQNPNKSFRAYTYTDKVDLQAGISTLKTQKKDLYFNLSTLVEHNVEVPKVRPDGTKYLKKSQRVHINTKSLKCFFLDIDCGEDKAKEKKGYATQTLGADALKKFSKTIGFPTPIAVNSGYGLHVYWPFTQSVPVDTWKAAALKFAQIAKALEFYIDPSRVSDQSSLLRVPTTINYKRGGQQPVFAIPNGEYELTDFEVLSKLLDIAAETYQVPYEAPPVKVSTPFDNIESNIQKVFDPVSGDLVVEKCLQMANCAETHGKVPEPVWFASLQIAAKFKNPDDWYYALSDGHGTFSKEETDAKVYRVETEFTGGVTCSYFDDINPGVCNTCPHQGKVKTPLSLGWEKKKESSVAPTPPPQISVAPALPGQVEPMVIYDDGEERPLCYPFEHGSKGVFYEGGDGLVQVTTLNTYPVNRTWDSSLDCEVIQLKAEFPHDGLRDVVIPVYTMVDTRTLTQAVAKQGVTVCPGQENSFKAYMINYLQKLQERAAASKNYAQLGWHDDGDTFVLADKSFHVGGREDTAGTSDNIETAVKFMRKRGTLEAWVKIVNTYSRPGYEGYAFGHLVGYGSLLFNFTKYHGATVSMVGDSGSGKSTVLHTINSIFGHPDEPMLTQRDTINSVPYIMGVMNSLCMTYDEITNIDPMELSQMCYSVTQGRDKFRLSADATLKENNSRWKMIMATTSNSNLMHKLSSIKMDSSAESLRVFEYYLHTDGHQLSKQEASETFDGLNDNFGHAGEIFVKYIMENQDKVKELVKAYTKEFDRVANIPTRERYWSAIVGSCLAGGWIAKKLGLCDFNIDHLLHWSVQQIDSMRNVINETTRDPIGILADFINNSIGETITIQTNGAALIESEPRHKISVRSELDNGIAYVDRAAIRRWMIKGGTDYNYIRKKLVDSGVLIHSDRKKVLSMGSSTLTSAQVTCWVVDMKHPDIAGRVEKPPTLVIDKKDIEKFNEVVND